MCLLQLMVRHNLVIQFFDRESCDFMSVSHESIWIMVRKFRSALLRLLEWHDSLIRRKLSDCSTCIPRFWTLFYVYTLHISWFRKNSLFLKGQYEYKLCIQNSFHQLTTKRKSRKINNGIGIYFSDDRKQMWNWIFCLRQNLFSNWDGDSNIWFDPW